MTREYNSLRASLTEHGYAVIKDAYKQTELDLINSIILKVLLENTREKNNANTLTDAWNIHPELLEWCLPPKVKSLLSTYDNQEMLLLRHSDVHMNFFAGNFHRDSVCRGYSDANGADWDKKDEYAILRFACYPLGCQFEIIPGSHKTHKKVNEATLIIDIKPGDLLVFDPRVMHRGVKPEKKKTSFFYAYGANNDHSIRHQKYYIEERKDLGYAELQESTIELIANKDLKILL